MPYDNTNRGALFGNKNKREGKQDPDLQGKLDIKGTEHWISGWMKTYEKDGKTFKMISLSLGDAVEQPKQRDGGAKEMDNDIPW